MKIKIPKFSLIEWLRSFRLRRADTDHSIAVRVYDNGHLILSSDRLAVSDSLLSAYTAANTMTSNALFECRRQIKLSVRKGRMS